MGVDFPGAGDGVMAAAQRPSGRATGPSHDSALGDGPQPTREVGWVTAARSLAAKPRTPSYSPPCRSVLSTR